MAAGEHFKAVWGLLQLAVGQRTPLARELKVRLAPNRCDHWPGIGHLVELDDAARLDSVDMDEAGFHRMTRLGVGARVLPQHHDPISFCDEL